MPKNTVNKPPVSQTKTGRPPKNMCKPCKGWGSLWTVLTKVYYYGSGDEQSREEQEGLVAEECKHCKGTGFKGGRLRTEMPPIMGRMSASTGSLKDRSIRTGDIAINNIFNTQEIEYQEEKRAEAKSRLEAKTQEDGS